MTAVDLAGLRLTLADAQAIAVAARQEYDRSAAVTETKRQTLVRASVAVDLLRHKVRMAAQRAGE